MRVNTKLMGGIAVIFLAIFAIYQCYPIILFKVMEWQKVFNTHLSGSLNELGENQSKAGVTLVFISFLYGVFHAVGPGHGKFILTSYLSLEKTKLPQAMKMTFASALVQGLVAVSLVTIIVVIFTLSRQYFNLTLKWVERGSFSIMILFGLYWCYQVLKSMRKTHKPTIKSIRFSQNSTQKIPLVRQNIPHVHDENCGCGHKHLPTSEEMKKAKDWKAQLMIILSIGARPCSGAILVLFLSYTLDLYVWGVISAFVMAIGTGFTLSLFAYLVIVARNRAIKVSHWYFSAQTNQKFIWFVKFVVGIALILLGITLFHSSFIDTSSSILFKR
ncbi:nickel/cobalt transporter [Mannheimia sp. AT1]|uniref:Nickel/cobalt efflux system n=1 Tax=Mannheimia cairinae TaxID=3025936 RepID=A0ABT5MRY3_9PAST|nr:nickel/cobalt transporter [Mannheimia cairinae]MDD0824728.1 nickel/cobalt transporter [Mannheimia cairinae]MDD0826343.1 nickel/cobalt transporter [Mannheimia cairinae]